MTAQEKIMIREYGREFSLFRAYTWQMIMQEIIVPMVGEGADEAIYLYNGDLVRAYYEPQSMKKLFAGIGRMAQDRELLKNKVAEFYSYFEKLEPYLKKEKAPQSLEELKTIYDWYFPYWAIWGIIYIIPNVATVDPDIKNLALGAREKTQEYNEAFEDILKEFLTQYYPGLKDAVRFILPQEFWQNKLELASLLDDIKQRKSGFVLYKGSFFTGDVAKILNDLGIKLEEGREVQKNIKEISGQIAHPGKIKGLIKIVLLEDDLNKVEEGNILVATMTMPKYLPAMKKAAAFVTDEGGITCHAAIIARELKKPCIIGTKIATKVLHDGDMVEVDANSGIVKILRS